MCILPGILLGTNILYCTGHSFSPHSFQFIKAQTDKTDKLLNVTDTVFYWIGEQ
jgi:hypothetical protein